MIRSVPSPALRPSRPVISLLITTLGLVISVTSGCRRSAEGVTDLDPAAFQQQLTEQHGLLIDVRTPGEFARGHLTDATPIDVTGPRFARQIALLQKDQPIFVYCASGNRSVDAAAKMREAGFTQVFNLSGGIAAWSSAGLPVDRAADTPPSTAQTVTPEAFDRIVGGSPRVLVDFQTPWCVPCRKLAPVVAALAEAWRGKVEVLTVDIEANEALAQREKVSGVPELVLYAGGKPRWRHSGETTRAVIEAELARP